ncbi:MAG: hypothetical protein ACO1OB_12635 [Archangium sp.]
MRSTVIRSSAWVVALVATAAFAHPTGFHKKLTITVTRTKLSALIVMDVDSGERCLLLREAVDSNRDGVLAGEEVAKLKERLVKMATGPLKLGISGAPLLMTSKEAKLSLREDRRANDSPLSVAVMFEIPLSPTPGEGTQLEVTDTSPDQSTIVLQVSQSGESMENEVPSGRVTKVRLGSLTE